MAKLKGDLKFLGTLDEITAYEKEGVKGIIVQRKGGPTKRQIEHGKQFEKTRLNMNEFRGRSAMQSLISKMLQPLKPCAGYNYTGRLNGLCKPIQEMDIVNEWGRRSIHLASAPQYLEGLQLSLRNPLETVFTSPLVSNISSTELRASVEVSVLQRRKNFFPIGSFPFYRFSFVLGVIPDVQYNESRKVYQQAFDPVTPVVVTGEWQEVTAISTATAFDLQLHFTPPGDQYSLLLAGGIMFGMSRWGKVEAVKGAGGGKILMVAPPGLPEGEVT